MFKTITIEVKKAIPIEWSDPEKRKPIKFKQEIDEYDFNLYQFSYWRGRTTTEGEERRRQTMLYLNGNPKPVTLNISIDDFRKQVEEKTKGDHEAMMHLAEAMKDAIQGGHMQPVAEPEGG